MAPTICSEKKTQIRSGIKDIRKQSNTNGLSTSPSSGFNYAQKRSKLIRPYPIRGKLSIENSNYLISSSSDTSNDENERFNSSQSPLSSISDNSISTSSESSLLSPLSLSSFPSPLGAFMSTDEDFSPCSDRLKSIHHINNDSSSICSISSSQNNLEIDDDLTSRSSDVILSENQNTNDTNKSNSRPLSMLQHQAKNTKGLFDIAIKTIKLVRRNQLLQRRLAQLQMETSEFIQSVLANPENQVLRDKMQAKGNCNHEMI